MYGREVEGETLTFLHSGKLWHDALVLADASTGSLWSQATGEALTGERAGRALERVPARLTTWGAWLDEHPGSRAVPSPRGRRKLKMRLYPYTNRMLGILGTDNPDPRLPGKTRVVGFETEDGPIAIPLARGGEAQIARLWIDGTAVIVRHAGGDGPTTAHRSTGPPDWGVLEPLPVSSMYWFVWAALHPDSRIVEPDPAP